MQLSVVVRTLSWAKELSGLKYNWVSAAVSNEHKGKRQLFEISKMHKQRREAILLANLGPERKTRPDQICQIKRH